MTPHAIAEELAAAPARAGLLLDFDGTLAPIVADPPSSRLSEGLAPVLAELAGRFAVVAVISGRPASFLAEQLPDPRLYLLGLYGLERYHNGAVTPDPDAASWQDAVDTALERAQDATGDLQGVWVEDKGMAVAIHWRNAPDRDAAEGEVAAVVERLAEETGLAREPGKLVEELRPPVDVDKGTAVRTLAGGEIDTLVYVGDDRGDLAGFAAVRELGGRCIAVRHGDETPDALLEAADATLEGSQGVVEWLERLADQTG